MERLMKRGATPGGIPRLGNIDPATGLDHLRSCYGVVNRTIGRGTNPVGRAILRLPLVCVFGQASESMEIGDFVPNSKNRSC